MSEASVISITLSEFRYDPLTDARGWVVLPDPAVFALSDLTSLELVRASNESKRTPPCPKAVRSSAMERSVRYR